jgi:GSH-dependent disulfide-bond oxidoreductase
MRFYFNFAPNPMKVALFLEEAGLQYEPIPIDTRKGEQLTPEYRAVNPNGKLPAIVDDGRAVFDSNAILLYLGEKTGKFVPGAEHRHELLSWLMFVASGVGPFSGQAVHFRHNVAEPDEYALNRYDFEAERHWRIIDDRLAKRPYMVGDQYSIVDMCVWGWARIVPYVMGGEADAVWPRFRSVHRLVGEVGARPAAQRVEAMKQKFTFKEEVDAEARRNLFPQLARLKAK